MRIPLQRLRLEFRRFLHVGVDAMGSPQRFDSASRLGMMLSPKQISASGSRRSASANVCPAGVANPPNACSAGNDASSISSTRRRGSSHPRSRRETLMSPGRATGNPNFHQQESCARAALCPGPDADRIHRPHSATPRSRLQTRRAGSG